MYKLSKCLMFLFAIFLAGCHQNPVLKMSADQFADAVNTFEDRDIGNQYAATCGYMYMTQDKSLSDPTAQQECNAYTNKLADYLKQHTSLTTITSDDLRSQQTWQHYFASKKAHGRGLSW